MGGWGVWGGRHACCCSHATPLLPPTPAAHDLSHNCRSCLPCPSPACLPVPQVEDVLNVIEKERPEGIIVQFGGQTPLKLASSIQKFLEENPIPAASGE